MARENTFFLLLSFRCVCIKNLYLCREHTLPFCLLNVMKNWVIIVLILSGVSGGLFAQNQNLTVESLMGVHVDSILHQYFVGEGVTITNGTFNGLPGNVTSSQIGVFNRNNFTQFPIASGLVMTTDNVSVAAGPNDNAAAGLSDGVVPYVEALLQPLSSEQLYNCASLEFDFRTGADTFAFRYVFASEEYCEFVHSQFNDIFAFFLTGPDPVTLVQTTVNVAIIPGSISPSNPQGIPVAINNVNHGYHDNDSPGPGTDPSYSQYFIHNSYVNGVQFDGYTTMLTAGGNIQPCTDYHMTLSICHAGDDQLASGVFFEEHSFESTPPPAFDMSNFFCMHDDIHFQYVAQNVDSIHIITPSGEILSQEPFVVTNVTAADTGCYILRAKRRFNCSDEGPWVNDTIHIEIGVPCVPQICGELEICSGEVITVPFAYESVIGPWVNFINDSLFTIESPSMLDHDTAVEYYISLYGANGCRLDTLVTLNFHEMPVTVIEDNVCEGAGYFANGFVIPKLETVGVDTLVRIRYVQTPQGCDSAIQLQLRLVDTNLRIISLTEDFCQEVYAELQVLTTFPDYLWSTGEQSPNITVHEPGLYAVTATLGNCTVSAGYHIDQCQFKMILPNTITPSRSDGLNEEFYIPEQVQQSINDFEIRIFNRWGEQVFYSTDKGFRWKGEYKGKINYDEVYTYVIHCLDANGKSHVYKGVITIL